MPEGDPSNERGASPEAAAAAALFSEWFELWLTSVRRTYERARDPEAGWSADEIGTEMTEALDEAMPLIERTIEQTLAYLQPWSQAYVSRVSGE